MFQTYLNRQSIFVNKSALDDEFLPVNLLHRDREQKQIASILLPALRGEKPSNLFIYGKTGTGKTIGAKSVCRELEGFARENNRPVKIVYVNAQMKKVADTEYRLISSIAQQYGVNLPSTGLPTEKIYKAFISAVENTKALSIIIIDEIDNVVRKCGNDLLYNLMRLNSELSESRVSVIGITNDLNLLKFIDSRVKSSLSEEELVFPPYDANQLSDILSSRAEIAFLPNALDQAVVPKCAAYAAKEHGDARRALNILRLAGELAERSGASKIEAEHVDAALDKLDTETVVEFVKSQPLQSKAVLYSILFLRNSTPDFTTGDIYDKYRQTCTLFRQKCLTQRRVSDLVTELAGVGIISTNLISKGRYGRSKTVDILMNGPTLDKVVNVLKGDFSY
ncbi:MAG: orc1/cdc6 family replication initiation protein [archaeon]